MSTIERAAKKLGAVSDDDNDDEQEQPTTPAAGAESDTSLAAQHTEATSDAADREDHRQEAGSHTGVAAHESLPNSAPAAEQHGPAFAVDLSTLAAGGFLTPDATQTQLAEEYQHIKRRLLGNMVEGMMDSSQPKNLILITSSLPSEGKTYTSTNLAISMALEMDRTVLVVDTDVIKGDLTRLFGLRGKNGLFDVLEGRVNDIGSVMYRTSIPNLVVVPCGQRGTAITEKLASEAMHNLVRELASRYQDRVILFDSAPVLATTGATALAPFMGQVVLVAEAERTPRDAIKHALANLDHVQVTGMILNKSRQTQGSFGYQYSYGYGYGYSEANKNNN